MWVNLYKLIEYKTIQTLKFLREYIYNYTYPKSWACFRSSSLNLGWAMPIKANVLSAVDLPLKFTAPYSVTTYWTSPLGSVAGPSILWTIREIVPLAAVE